MIIEQFREVMQSGNVVTPAYIHDDDDPRSGDITLGVEDISSPLRVNDIYVVADDVLISQSGYIIPISKVEKSLRELIAKEMLHAEEHMFDAWFVKVEQ